MRLVYVSDLDITGSGYRNLSLPLCVGLADKGYDIKVIGLGYKNEPHEFDFSLVPARNFQEVIGTIRNMDKHWKFDCLIVGFDVPVHITQFLPNLQGRDYGYIGITPIESDPLVFSWAMAMQEMDKVLVISKFGTEEANRVGIPAEHIPIGIDCISWRIPTEEEKSKIKKNYGYDKNTFIVFTNADNQERKFLSRSMEIFADFVYDYPGVNAKIIREKELKPVVDAKYILLTRPTLPVGWDLYSLSAWLGIDKQVVIFDRGLDFKHLWSLYAISDVHLLTSQAEGLGMPVLEAMASGVVNLGTNCGGIREQISDDRGYLIEYDYTYINPFGNNNRYMASRNDGYEKLKMIYKSDNTDIIEKARKYAESLRWEIGVDILDKKILEVIGD